MVNENEYSSNIPVKCSRKYSTPVEMHSPNTLSVCANYAPKTQKCYIREKKKALGQYPNRIYCLHDPYQIQYKNIILFGLEVEY